MSKFISKSPIDDPYFGQFLSPWEWGGDKVRCNLQKSILTCFHKDAVMEKKLLLAP